MQSSLLSLQLHSSINYIQFLKIHHFKSTHLVNPNVEITRRICCILWKHQDMGSANLEIGKEAILDAIECSDSHKTQEK